MKIKQQLPLLHVAAGRRVRVAKEEMPPRMGAGIRAHPAQHVAPAGVIAVVQSIKPTWPK